MHKPSPRSTTLWMCFSLVAFMISGCGNSSGRPAAELRGTVTFDGKPLDEGSIHFSSAKTGESAYANLKPDGTYAIEFPEVDVGETYEVAIGEEVLNLDNIPAHELPPAPKMKAKVPKSYFNRQTSGLSAVIKSPGVNEFNFELQAK